MNKKGGNNHLSYSPKSWRQTGAKQKTTYENQSECESKEKTE
jgi:hypothetical protein